MSTPIHTLAQQLVALCRDWKFLEAQATLLHEDAVNIESDGRITRGREAIMAKEKAFLDNIEAVHLLEISDPVVADGYFAVQFHSELTVKGIGRRSRNEIIVYEVKDDLVIREQFFYHV
ncbi:SnoaL-like domain-containing protein [Chitinophaga qingshengii]|uniref:Nuclear transport factor 2 family protein n=1 Tax=Chitinophaga qingshengii TaxID=1569794 RepID=A0ABR7TUG1_9BACT|nr:SnoaL-like domain-containing protein [Chitinophaga qingshengii]MBC9934114.1 nuclear transport factor 2 family protein [Chitinophaga qingshengii]